MQESILVRKIMIEIGALSLDGAKTYFDALVPEDSQVDSLMCSLCPFPRNIKILTQILSEWLQDNRFSSTQPRLRAAAIEVGKLLFAQYKTGEISLKNMCFFLNRLPSYGCYEYQAVSDCYDMYTDGICSSVDDVRRVLDDVFQNPYTEISLKSITKLEDETIYFRDEFGDELPILNLKECRGCFQKNVEQHPDEYPHIKKDSHYVADCCWKEEYVFFLFYTPSKVYVSSRIKPSKWHTFCHRIGWNRSKKHYLQLYAFQQQINQAGYSIYDLTS